MCNITLAAINNCAQSSSSRLDVVYTMFIRHQMNEFLRAQEPKEVI